MKVAFVSGTSIAHSAFFADWRPKTVATAWGPVVCKVRGDFVLLNRHGFDVPLPPHAINHRANLRALADLGCREVVALCSVGSLQPGLPPGTVVACADFVALQQGPQTFIDDDLRRHRTAGATPNNLIPRLVTRLAPEFAIKTGKIYVQMRGPRFETKAEIRIIRHWGDVVGMTAAHESDLCGELGLNYNCLAMIDNWANGLKGAEVTPANFPNLVRANQAKVDRLFVRLLEILGE